MKNIMMISLRKGDPATSDLESYNYDYKKNSSASFTEHNR
jgi:hypothetical protein